MWRRDEDLRIESAVDAKRFIEDVGFANTLTDARRAGPSLRHRGVRRRCCFAPLHPESTSCEAAVRTKPKARLCEPWVDVVIDLFGAAEQRRTYWRQRPA